MRKLILIVCVLLSTPTISFGRDIVSEIREQARKEYPNDYSMQEYIFENQLSAFRYIEKVANAEIKSFAINEYPNDYKMQKYVYDNQISAFEFMQTVNDKEIKAFAIREYPNDYRMQKYIYKKQLESKKRLHTSR